MTQPADPMSEALQAALYDAIARELQLRAQLVLANREIAALREPKAKPKK